MLELPQRRRICVRIKIQRSSMYLDAFSKLEANESGAMSAFAALVGMREDDCLASFHLKRLLNGERGTAIKLS